MRVRVRQEAGYDLALEGIGYSYNMEDIERLKKVSEKLAPKDGGHNKFLESIVVWLDIDAPRYWWSEFDTYRIGVTKQSESTMHTITHRHLTQNDFADEIYEDTLKRLNDAITLYNVVEKNMKEDLFREIKNNLPEGFLQRRMVCTNYKVLKHMMAQRKQHRLHEWKFFVVAIMDQVEHPELLASVFG
jgi:hypothetical protein